jgi:hypothetical protein
MLTVTGAMMGPTPTTHPPSNDAQNKVMTARRPLFPIPFSSEHTQTVEAAPDIEQLEMSNAYQMDLQESPNLFVRIGQIRESKGTNYFPVQK